MPIKNRRTIRFHGLKRPKLRADMNKYTLYNLARVTAPPTASRTFFQQKWTAKSISRAYHGEYIREGQWTRMFDRRAPAVVPMNAGYLAGHDGSDQSAGRGSGRQIAPVDPAEEGKRKEGDKKKKAEIKKPDRTPYMQMVYHPIERRLDFAVYRSLFASSAKQARQMVLHGYVTVNGKKMQYPSYLLNPGDLFQADPTRVMVNMGQRKLFRDKASAKRLAHQKKKGTLKPAAEGAEDAASAAPADSPETTAASSTPTTETYNPSTTPTPDPTEEENELDADLDAEETSPADEEEILDTDPAAAAKKTLKTLMKRTRAILQDPKTKKNMSGKLKIDFRAYYKELRSTMSRVASATPSALEDLEAQFTTLAARLQSGSFTPSPPPSSSSTTTPEKTDPNDTPEMAKALALARLNPYDPTLPYRTPWAPRDWMSAFAFIPRYLEVNHLVCGAVYLRHPVCYPGAAEVPTPFHPETGQLAHSWYLRRR